MLSQELGPFPVIANPNCGESVVREKARDLLKVMVFLLTGVKCSGIDLLELQSFAHEEEYRPTGQIFPARGYMIRTENRAGYRAGFDPLSRVLHSLRILLMDLSPLPHLQECA